MNKEKIGIGIITCIREHFLRECYKSIPSYIDKIIVVDVGELEVIKMLKNIKSIKS